LPLRGKVTDELILIRQVYDYRLNGFRKFYRPAEPMLKHGK
jgi:hypothetical protein